MLEQENVKLKELQRELDNTKVTLLLTREFSTEAEIEGYVQRKKALEEQIEILEQKIREDEQLIGEARLWSIATNVLFSLAGALVGGLAASPSEAYQRTYDTGRKFESNWARNRK